MIEATDDRDRTAADLGWLALAVAAGLSTAANLIVAAVVLVFGPRGMNLVLLPAWALTSWWFARGAWLRTRWGRPAPGTAAPWHEPVLTERRAALYVWLGAVCVVSAAIALSLQALYSAD